MSQSQRSASQYEEPFPCPSAAGPAVTQDPRAATLILMVGLPAAGKTTRARELAATHQGIDLQAILQIVAMQAEIVLPAPLGESVCEDPDDDKFLACAVASGVTCIVSGDKHLLRVSGYRGICVLRPREFVERYLSR